MISKHILSAPKNDNYARLANYIAAGHEYSMDIQNEERIYDPQRNVSASQGVAGNRLRQLSECRLASYSQREQKREIADFLPADARPDRRAADSLRGNENLSKSMMPEKCLMSWCAGCWAGDDYDLAVQEVADTQALNRRTGKEKTYHLLVSFHPEDEGKLTPDVFKQIEERFADALGLSEHQRHCGVHVNTENIHMHVAYNLIHPEKLTRVEPWRDYLKRDKLCRELEKEYGLIVDNGREAGKERGLGSKAAAMEAHSGQQSFEGFARQESIAVLASLEQCQSWEDVHQAFATHGLELRRRGAGLVIKDRYGRQMAKASTAHREFSLKKLEGRFGQFQAAKGQFPDSERRYGISPIQTEGNCGWSSPKGTRSRKRNWRAYARSGDGSGKSWQPSLWPARPGHISASCHGSMSGRKSRQRAPGRQATGWIFCVTKPSGAMKPPWPSCDPGRRLSLRRGLPTSKKWATAHWPRRQKSWKTLSCHLKGSVA